LLAEALADSLRGQAGVEVAGCSESAEEVLPALMEAADVVLIGLGSRPAEARRAVTLLHAQAPEVTLLPIGLREERQVIGFLEAGAAGYVLAAAGIEEMVRTIRGVHRGEPPCSERVVEAVCARIRELDHLRHEQRKMARVRLTAREEEVLLLLAEGLLNKEIASRLRISLATVKNHVHHILTKLSARNRRDALRRAYLGGHLPAPLPRTRARASIPSGRRGWALPSRASGSQSA
jgi:DNA-binding NarL/FixJ family response regulator